MNSGGKAMEKDQHKLYPLKDLVKQKKQELEEKRQRSRKSS